MTVTIRADSGRIHVSGRWEIPPVSEVRDSVGFQLWSRMTGLRARFLVPADLEPSTLRSGEQGGDRGHTLRPARPIAPGEMAIVEFEYDSDTIPAPQFRIGPAGSFAGGGGELWYPQSSFSIRDVGRLTFVVRPGEVVIAPGQPLEDGERARREGRFTFEVTTPSKFGFAAGPYHVRQRDADPPFRLYLLADRPGADDVLDSVAGAARTLRRWFGPLPFPALALVEVEFGGAVLGTSEFGFIFADRRQFDREFDFPYWAHELGHQWWGVTVRTRSGTPGRMFMSEGLAEFGALLAIEAVQGDAAAAAYRRGRYPGRIGQTTMEYFRLAAAGLEIPLAIDPGNRTTLMHRMANTRGFMLLNQMADHIGPDRFVRVLGEFARENQSEPTSYGDFRLDVERAGGTAVSRMFDQWLERTGAPYYRVEWHTAEGRVVEGSITQDDPPFDAQVELELYGPGGVTRHVVPVRGTRTPFVIRGTGAVDSVVLDPDFRVLRWTAESLAQAHALADYTRAEWERRYGDRHRAIEAFRMALDDAPPPSRDPHGVRFLLEWGLGRALADSGALGEARRHFEAALALPSRRPEALPLVWVSLARVASSLGDAETVRRAARHALAADSAIGGRTGAVADIRRLQSR
jgi:tetratricopeptide (TPR) repeat protein